jgi:hypothetical protein
VCHRRAPRQLLHDEHVDETIELGSCLQRILNLHTFRAVDLLHRGDDVVEVALVGVELVDEEDDGLLELVGISERVLGAYLRAILAVDEDHRLVGNVQRSDCASYKVV